MGLGKFFTSAVTAWEEKRRGERTRISMKSERGARGQAIL